MSKSFVIWFLDNKYTYAWGENEEDAKAKYLANWAAGIKAVVSSEDYLDALPPQQFIPCQKNAVWENAQPSNHMPLYETPGFNPEAPE